MEFIYKLKNIFFDILFPSICLNCKINLTIDEKNKKVCEKCIDSIIIYSSFFCPKCKNRVPTQEKTCHKEIKFLLAPVTDYQNPVIKNIIRFFKYKKWKSLMVIITPLINNYLDNLSQDLKSFIIIPIPLHKDRFKERGFNQSEYIAKVISEKTKAEINTGNLKRIKATKTQADSKNLEERVKNIKNCFALENPEEIKNKNILLVDDVFTSGSTMTEAVKILKQSGAKKIIAFVLAKA